MIKKNESIAFSGKIGEIIHSKMSDGRTFERYRRPPGVRLIIVSPDKKILVTKEFRHENNGFDFRLPGGKVRDSLDLYHELLSSQETIEQAASEAAKKEAIEETGLIVDDLELITIANAGATVEWDLYYFLVRSFTPNPNGQQLELGEDIEITWMDINAIKEAIYSGNMAEWRSVGVLLGLVIPMIQSNK